jgi:hypothetical protein
MEPRFGHDFSRVRVHTDARAASSARAVNALAYTVGEDIVFAPGHYSPQTKSGERLLAHELVHTIQQAPVAALSPTGIAGSAPLLSHFQGRMSSLDLQAQPKLEVSQPTGALEREADSVAQEILRFGAGASASAETGTPALAAQSAVYPLLQRASEPERSEPATKPQPVAAPSSAKPPSKAIREIPAPPQLEMLNLEIGEDALAGPYEQKQSDLSFSLPLAAVPSPCTPTTALTWSDFKGTVPQSPWGAETHYELPTVGSGAKTRFRAKFIFAKSWVKPQYKYASDPAKNGCNEEIAECEAWLKENPGGWWEKEGEKATTIAECKTKLGPICNATAQWWSDWVLKHEQGHFDITCIFAGKANAALDAGKSLRAVMAAMNKKVNPQQKLYDEETNHSVNIGQQDAWDTKIASELPEVTIP